MPKSVSALSKLPAAHAKRLAWALTESGHLLTAAVREDTSPEARQLETLPEGQIPEHVARLIQGRADPTTAKTMTGWLVKQYAQKTLRLEDLGTANETLDMFHRYARRLPKGRQDLGQYQSLARVWEVVSPIAQAEHDKLSGKAQKALDRDKDYAESRILRQDDDGFTVAVPLTEFAAKWWGRGTRWCTAAEKDNQFWQYHKDAPLIVIVIPELKEKGKFQIWVNEGHVQFRDTADRPVCSVLITEYWPRFELVMSYTLRQNGRALVYVPWDLRTEETCRIAVTQNGAALMDVPRDLRTAEMCRIAVAQNGRALAYVPEDLRTEKICRLAVAQNGAALAYVPMALRTEEMCRIAVAQNGPALGYVPEKLRTEEMCSIAVTQNGLSLIDVPRDLRTEEMCSIAVTQSGGTLAYVPRDLRTAEMCRIAVAQNGLALGHIPEALRTAEMCSIAVAQNGWALHDVPQKLRTEELCRMAVAYDGQVLQCVPESLRTEEMCKIAVAQNGRALTYVPEKLRDAIKDPLPPPVQEWDISLLDELTSILGAPSSPAPSGAPHA